MNGRRNRGVFVGTTAALVALMYFTVLLLGQSATQPGKTGDTADAQARLAAAERVCQMLHDEVDGAAVRSEISPRCSNPVRSVSGRRNIIWTGRFSLGM